MTGYSSDTRLSATHRAAKLRRSAWPAMLALAIVLASCGGGGGEDGANGIATGTAHACALRNGAVSCWGFNLFGQVGDGTTNDSDKAVRVEGLSGVRAIAAGASHSCAVVSDGVECWGRNDSMILGRAALPDDHSATPVRVDELSGDVQAIGAGVFHTCVLTTNGAVKCWGDNTKKQLGAATGSASATPLQVPGLGSGVEAIAVGGDHTCALLNGGVKCWGDGYGGVLGDGNAGAHTRATPYDAIPAGSGVTAIATSPGTTCAIVSGQIKCWGLADVGLSGAGCASEWCPTPVDVMAAPAGTTSVAVSDANLYLLVNGGVRAMGADRGGELGDGEPKSSSTSLVNVSGLTSNVAAVSSWSAFACAMRENHQVLCWGQNYSNQLGDETTTNRSAPVAVHGL